MRQLVIFIFLSVFTLAMQGCTGKVLPRTIIACFDISNSRDSSVHNWYKQIVEQILRKCRPTDRLVVLPVDRNSQTASQELFSADFSQNIYGNEFSGLDAEKIESKNHNDSIQVAIQTFHIALKRSIDQRQAYSGGSEIIGSLSTISKYQQEGSETIIIYLSDMLLVDDSLNFEEELNTIDEIPEYLEKVSKVNLSNTRIVVLTGDQSAISAAKFKVIKAFWETYFEESKAVLLDYSSGNLEALNRLFHE